MSDSNCPVCACAEIISGKWTLLVIRDLADGSKRFCELERSLEEQGVVERHTYPEVPPRVEYALTDKGRDLAPLIEDMREYGKRWLCLDEDGNATAREGSPDGTAEPAVA